MRSDLTNDAQDKTRLILYDWQDQSPIDNYILYEASNTSNKQSLSATVHYKEEQ